MHYLGFLCVCSSYIHWKLLAGWLVIILLDTMADFRLEFVYPAFMFARSVYDSYKYQGLVCANTAHTLYYCMDLCLYRIMFCLVFS